MANNLFDFLGSDSGGVGLLAFLRNNAMNQQFPSGRPEDQAQYGDAPPQPNPMDAMARMRNPQAQPLPLPELPARQPAPPAQQQPQQQGGPDFGNNLMTGFQSFANSGSLLGGLANGIAGLSTGQRQDPAGIAQQNQNTMFRAYQQAGLSPSQAMIATLNPKVGEQLLGGGETSDIKEYHFAKKEDPSLTFAKFMQQKKSVSGEYGMTPIWGVKDGKPAILQLGKSGSAVQAGMPEGFELSRDPIKVEGPTGTSILDPQTRQVIQFIPKDVAGAAKAHEIGQAEGQATVNLPTAIATAENTLKSIDQLEKHPGKKSWGAFGLGAMLPDRPGSDVRGFAALLDQVKGQNFMTAFQSLKGAGAITETEGTKAEKAQARLDRAQSEKDFDIALKDLKDVVTAGMERARQKAGIKNGDASPTPKANADLKKKYGLD